MRYSELVSIYDRLGATASKLEKTSIITEFLKETPPELLDTVPHLLMGTVFPSWSPLDLGVGPGLVYDAITFVTGIRKEEVKDLVREEGDIGSAAEKLFQKKAQTTLFSETLTVEKIRASLEKVARAEGTGSQDRKLKIVAELLSNAQPAEAKYLIRTILGELRVGVAEGLLRDAIAKAFGTTPEVVERAYMLSNDIGRVASIAAREGEEGLKGVSMTVGVPIKPMLAQLAPSMEKVLEDIPEPALEVKYDGARIQIHKDGESIRIFSRRLEDVTAPLPDVLSRARQAIKADRAIVEGEAVAMDPKTGRPAPFQDILRRFRRKYGVTAMVEEIPFEVYVFDCLFVDDGAIIDRPFRERRQELEAIIEPVASFELAVQLVTKSLEKAEAFYRESLEMGHEGLMIKNLDAPYIPGARVGHMYKIKPVMETLDLVIVGAHWGTGKRKGWLSSYVLGARDEATGELLPVGRVGTGVTEEQLEEFTNLLRPLIEFEAGTEVRLKPQVVVEVAYQEIQSSPNYESGFALRFPRIVRLREDKSPREADDLDRIRALYDSQRSQG
ncbi:MAG: ATP-dependent DNA ligase [Euryarchaeota archaeon]|nr:ATP-dependent DNA ligase [Euryarchaeota archaeon]